MQNGLPLSPNDVNFTLFAVQDHTLYTALAETNRARLILEPNKLNKWTIIKKCAPFTE